MSEEGEKSILDHFPVKDEAFPLSNPADDSYVTTSEEVAASPEIPGTTSAMAVPSARLSVVGNCPRCGAPVYGPRSLSPGEAYVTSHSCGCRTLGTNNCSEGETMAEKKTAKKKAAPAPAPAKTVATKGGKKGKK